MRGNEAQKIEIVGDALTGYTVWAIVDGQYTKLPARAVTIIWNSEGNCEAVCYFTNPTLLVEAPRASDGVRAG